MSGKEVGKSDNRSDEKPDPRENPVAPTSFPAGYYLTDRDCLSPQEKRDLSEVTDTYVRYTLSPECSPTTPFQSLKRLML